jgi:hypothetical protein
MIKLLRTKVMSRIGNIRDKYLSETNHAFKNNTMRTLKNNK